MTWPLQEEFNPEGPISQVPLEWFKDVALILNYLTGTNCTIEKTAAPSAAAPWRVDVDLSSQGIDPIPEHPASTLGQVLTSTGETAPSWQDVPSDLPAQATHSEKFLTTNGSVASWAAIKQLGNGTASGQVLVWNGTAWTVLSIGTEGQFLRVSVGASPIWQDLTLPLLTAEDFETVTVDGGPSAIRQAIISTAYAAGEATLEWADIVVAPIAAIPTGLVWWDSSARQFAIYASGLAQVPIINLFAGNGTLGRFAAFDAAGVGFAVAAANAVGLYIGSGGTKVADQVLTLKGSGAGFYASWETGGSLPSGTAGDMLIYTAAWAVLAKPNGTKLLQNASGTFSWVDAPTGVPAGGSTSMVLQKSSATDYALEWDWVRTV